MGCDLMRARHRILMAKPMLMPSSYQRVENLYKSDAYVGPWIDITGIAVAQNDILTFKVKLSPTATPRENAFGISRASGFYVETYYNSSGTLKMYTSNSGAATQISSTTGEVYDTLVVKSNKASTLTRFGAYNTEYLFDGFLFGMTIADSGGNLRNNLIPCYRKSDSEPGFYDTITKIFYANAAENGTFVPGNNVYE